MTIERPEPARGAGIRYYDADYAPPGATNVLNHGWAVIDADGEQVGKVDQVYDDAFTIAEGYVIHDLVYAPFAAIERVDVDREQVYLNVTQARMEAGDWGAPLYDAGFGSADAGSPGPSVTSHEGGIVRPSAGIAEPAAGTGRPAAGAPAEEVVVVEEVIVVETPPADEGPDGTRRR